MPRLLQLRHVSASAAGAIAASSGPFIKDYGAALSSIMGFFGSAYTLRDDVPRWVEIVRNPRRNDSLVAATGWPQAFYVLYPWQGWRSSVKAR